MMMSRVMMMMTRMFMMSHGSDVQIIFHFNVDYFQGNSLCVIKGNMIHQKRVRDNYLQRYSIRGKDTVNDQEQIPQVRTEVVSHDEEGEEQVSSDDEILFPVSSDHLQN